MSKHLAISVCALLAPSCTATVPRVRAVQDAPEKSADEIAKELSNPTAALASLNANFIYRELDGNLPGANGQDSFSLFLQPAFPFPQGDGYNLIFRPGISLLTNEPFFDTGTGSIDTENLNLSDLGFDLAYGTTTPGGTLMLGGLVGTIPTATDDDLGRSKWALGPEVALGLVREWGVVGALVSHQWDVAGGGSTDINQTGAQYFYAVSLVDGWQLGAGPTISYNHEVNSDNALSLPLGPGRVSNHDPRRASVEILS